MKIVSWNCQGAFRKKASSVVDTLPDIAVIQECEPLNKLNFPVDVLPPYSQYWFGDGKKGVGVFSYTNLEFQLHECYDPVIRHCIPLVVQADPPFHLLAIWAMADPNRRYSYVGQVHLALRAYSNFISAVDTVIVGDFNSNSIWDNGRPKIGTHTDLVYSLNGYGITSLYHEVFEENHGKESTNTFHLYRKAQRGYHIDYCFAPARWLEQLANFSIGKYAEWSHLSDHCPLFINFKERS